MGLALDSEVWSYREEKGHGKCFRRATPTVEAGIAASRSIPLHPPTDEHDCENNGREKSLETCQVQKRFDDKKKHNPLPPKKKKQNKKTPPIQYQGKTFSEGTFRELCSST